MPLGYLHQFVLKMSVAFLGDLHPGCRFGISNNTSNQIRERPFHFNTDGERVESFTCWQKNGVLHNFGKSRHLLVDKFSQILPDYVLQSLREVQDFGGNRFWIMCFHWHLWLLIICKGLLVILFPRISWLCLNFITCKFPTLALISHWTVYATGLLFLELLRNYFS